MSKFTETVKQDTPRLVVKFDRSDKGEERFSWGMLGKIPTLGVIGFLHRVQGDITFRNPEHCDEQALVIAWDEEKKKFSWFLNRKLPVDALIGMLETIKQSLVNVQMQSMMAAQQTGLVAANGQPITRKPIIQG